MESTMRVALLASLILATAGCPGPTPLAPLALAARHGDVVQIAALAAAGHDVNAFDAAGNRWTPLLHAIHKGQRASVAALIEAKADVNLSAPGTPSPLLMAAGNGQAHIVRRLLAAGANPHQNGETLLAVAVSGGAFTDIQNPLLGRCNTEIVKALIERAPDLRLRDDLRGRLARWFARLNRCEKVIRLAAAPAVRF